MTTALMIDNSRERCNAFVHILQDKFQLMTAKDYNSFTDLIRQPVIDIQLILLNVTDPALNGIQVLEYIQSHSISIPVVIVTDDVHHSNMQTAFEKGAVDYVTYDTPDYLLKNRLINILSAFKKIALTKKLEATEKNINDAFFFQNCMGAAVILKVTGEKITPLLYNNKFFETVNRDRTFFEEHEMNLEKTILPMDYEAYRHAVFETIQTGNSSCILHHGKTDQVFYLSYNHISHIKDSDVILAMIRDITNQYDAEIKLKALTELPGTIIFDYSSLTDSITFQSTQTDDLQIYNCKNFLEENQQNVWISPESKKRVWLVFQHALLSPVSGMIDFQGCFNKKKPHHYRWHRAYYRSLATGNGTVNRIVGRIDDVERNVWSGLPIEEHALFDASTQLMTFHALKIYIKQHLEEKKSGVVLLLDLFGIQNHFEKMAQPDRDHMMRTIATSLKKHFYKGDIFGRFGNEGFIIFLPETSSLNVAKKKAQCLLDTSFHILCDYHCDDIKCNIGIAATSEKNTNLDALMDRATTALWHAKQHGNLTFYYCE